MGLCAKYLNDPTNYKDQTKTLVSKISQVSSNYVGVIITALDNWCSGICSHSYSPIVGLVDKISIPDSFL